MGAFVWANHSFWISVHNFFELVLKKIKKVLDCDVNVKFDEKESHSYCCKNVNWTHFILSSILIIL